ncbi:class I SAM-dependent methyltransferase [Streptacidiphilus cavernicola]|uniref:Trans-aconitate 2-methyltransferase n=1 Tax=Streptacidiphilus cavernicola TaxID=3342716 RepID=A0ABV6VP43_9ACTN
MPTLPREQPEPSAPEPSLPEPHTARRMAESFGVDAQRYDHARPGYPDALVSRIVAGDPGTDVRDRQGARHVRDVLDVGCGTGIAARQFQAAGCTVLGVDPDPRMADAARARGLRVEVAAFEAWQPDGRTFDAVVAAQSWHWVDPVAGTAKAAQLLRPGGRLAVFGHVYEPPAEVAEPFAAAYRRAVPDSPFNNQAARRPLDLYHAMYAKFADRIRETGQFDEPEQWRFDWERYYSRDQWLDLLPTTGGLTQLSPGQLAEVLDAVGSAIDTLGGGFTLNSTTLAVTAMRAAAP